MAKKTESRKGEGTSHRGDKAEKKARKPEPKADRKGDRKSAGKAAAVPRDATSPNMSAANLDVNVHAQPDKTGRAKPKLLPLEKFVDYGRWFQQRVAPDIDRRKVLRVTVSDGGFRLTLADGDTVFARRVVMAQGLLGHEHRPAEFAGMPFEFTVKPGSGVRNVRSSNVASLAKAGSASARATKAAVRGHRSGSTW